jgi:hypothetical protein
MCFQARRSGTFPTIGSCSKTQEASQSGKYWSVLPLSTTIQPWCFHGCMGWLPGLVPSKMWKGSEKDNL